MRKLALKVEAVACFLYVHYSIYKQALCDFSYVSWLQALVLG